MNIDSIKQKLAALVAWLQKLSTESDNQTPCPVRVGVFAVALTYHLAVLWMVFGQGQKITMDGLGQYIQQMMILVGVAAGSIGVKSVLGGDAK